MITLALATDERGFAINATLIASILRRTARSVWVRCWCRGFLPESFETGRLRVEFLPAVEAITGRYPGSSGPSAYDRLLVIRDCPDWDRCMVMDYDQLVRCDMGPLFELELGDHLLAAHMQGPGVDIAYAMRVWLKQPLPEGWEQVAGHPYFLMPPMLNLKAMREAETWEIFLRAHAAFGADEQLSLTAATEGRSLPLAAKWNLFPKLHIREGEVPEGIIHFSGWPKPWHKGAKVWRPDIWESERSSWEHLRMGIWDKPVAIEVEPEDGRGVRALAERGWKVRVVFGQGEASGIGQRHWQVPDYPDVKIHWESALDFQAVLAAEAGRIDSVRLGQWTEPDEWFEGVGHLFLMEVNLRVTGPVGDEILGAGLTAVLHAGFHDKPREQFTYETREASAACVRRDEGHHYFTGAVQGGRTADFLTAAGRMAEAVARDAHGGVTAVWHGDPLGGNAWHGGLRQREQFAGELYSWCRRLQTGRDPCLADLFGQRRRSRADLPG